MTAVREGLTVLLVKLWVRGERGGPEISIGEDPRRKA